MDAQTDEAAPLLSDSQVEDGGDRLVEDGWC
jgi:hypothetical protein